MRFACPAFGVASSSELRFTMPECGSTFSNTTPTMMFEWGDAPAGASYGVWMGSSPRTADYFINQGPVFAGQPFNTSGLPNDGSPVYATIFYAPDGDWTGFNGATWPFVFECQYTAYTGIIITPQNRCNAVGTEIPDISDFTELDPNSTIVFDGNATPSINGTMLLEKVWMEAQGTSRKVIIIRNTRYCQIDHVHLCGPDAWFPRQMSEDGVVPILGPVLLLAQDNVGLTVTNSTFLGGNRSAQFSVNKGTVCENCIFGMSIHNSVNSYRPDFDGAQGCDFTKCYAYTRWPLDPMYAGRGTDSMNWFEPVAPSAANSSALHTCTDCLVEGNGPNSVGVGFIVDGNSSGNTGHVEVRGGLAMDNINAGMGILQGGGNYFHDSICYQGAASPLNHLSLANQMLTMYDTRSDNTTKDQGFGLPTNIMENIEGEWWTDIGGNVARRGTIDCTSDQTFCWGHPSSRWQWININTQKAFTRKSLRQQWQDKLIGLPCFPFPNKPADTHWIEPY